MYCKKCGKRILEAVEGMCQDCVGFVPEKINTCNDGCACKCHPPIKPCPSAIRILKNID